MGFQNSSVAFSIADVLDACSDTCDSTTVEKIIAFKYIIIIIIIINCNLVVARWQWLFDTNTKYDIGLLLNLRREGYMRSMQWQLGMLGTISAFA